MKRLAVIFLAFLFFASAEAQEKPILEFEKPTKFKIQKIASHADVDGNVLYLIFGSYKCHMKYFDKEMNLKDEFAFKKDFADEMPSFIGSSKKDNIISFFTQKKTEKRKKNEIEINAWEINISDLSKTKLNQKVISLKNADIITAYPKGDDFFFTYSPYESDTIKFVNLSNPKNSIKSFKLPGIKHDELFDKKLWINVDTDNFVDIASQTSSKKYYHKGDVLYLVSDEKNYSELININLSNSEVTIKKFESKKINLGFIQVQKISSYLLSNTLFQFYASIEEGRLNIFNIDNQRLIKSYNFDKTMDNIPFSNTPITLTKFAYDPPIKEEVKKPKKLLRKITKLNTVITALQDVNNNYIVELGAIETYTYNYYYHNHWMHHHMMYTPPVDYSQFAPTFHGPSFDENLYFHLYQPALETSGTKLITFKMVLNANTLEHISGKPKVIKHIDFDELVDEHYSSLKEQKVKFSTNKKYKYKDHYHKIGYNKKTKTIQVYEIKPKETSK